MSTTTTTGTTWPKRGFRGTQPWEKDESPIELSEGLPILAAGSAHPIVHELGRKLAVLGYDNPTARGQDPFGIVSPELMAAVVQFRRDYNVKEDPSAFGGDNQYGEENASSHIGPWTIQAIKLAEEPQAA